MPDQHRRLAPVQVQGKHPRRRVHRLQKDQVTDIDVEKFLQTAPWRGSECPRELREAAGDDKTARMGCLYSDEVKEQVRKSLGREENVTI